MLRTLAKHQIQSFKRSLALNQELVKTCFLVILGLYFALNFLALGYLMSEYLDEAFPDADTFLIVGKGILYYFMFEFLMRLLLQKFPGLEIKPYLAKPIRKGILAHYLLLRSLGSFFNYLSLFALAPYFIKSIAGKQSGIVSLNFLLFYAGMILMVNFLSFLVDRFFKTKTWVAIVLAGSVMGVLYLDFSGYIGLGKYLESGFRILIHNTSLSLLPMVLASVLYYLLYRMFVAHTYLEDTGTTNSVEATPFSFGFAKWFGQAGQLMDLETKLIWRSKRSRTFLFISIAMLAYPALIGNDDMRFVGFQIFIGLFATGIFALSYGQLLLSWNSPHFDLLLTRNLEIADIFKAKYYLLVASCAITLMALPFWDFWDLYSIIQLLVGRAGISFSAYFFIDRELFFTGVVIFLYNIGVSIYLYMFLEKE